MLTWKQLADNYDEVYNLVNSDERSLDLKYDEVSKLLKEDDPALMDMILKTFSDNDRNGYKHHLGYHTEEFIKELGGLEGYDEWGCEDFVDWDVKREMEKNPPSVPSVVTISGTSDLPVTFEILKSLDDLSCNGDDDIMTAYGYHHHDDVDRIGETLGEYFADRILEPLARIAVKDYSIELPDPSLSIKEMNDYGYTFNKMLPLSKERAMEIWDKADITVYALYGYDDSEAMIRNISQFGEHKGLFGIELNDWKIARERLAAVDALSVGR